MNHENKRDVDQLVEHLGMMGYDAWVDESLRGGQDWWEEILQRIVDSDGALGERANVKGQHSLQNYLGPLELSTLSTAGARGRAFIGARPGPGRHPPPGQA